MPLTIEPLHPLFAGLADGVNLNQPLETDTVDAIRRAVDEFGVLVFRDQPLTPCQQLELARSFGPLDKGLLSIRHRPESLLTAESDVAGGDWFIDHTERSIENRLWHSDSSFQNPAAGYSMMAAVRVPATGGDTEFADLRAAHDALPDTARREIQDLEAEHYASPLRAMPDNTNDSSRQQHIAPPATWPLVRIHPQTGRPVLFVSSHAHSIQGWPLSEGRTLLVDLLEHATQRDFVYRHRWRSNDLVIWDNRCTVHRGRRFDDSQPRELRRATTLDLDTVSDRRIA